MFTQNSDPSIGFALAKARLVIIILFLSFVVAYLLQKSCVCLCFVDPFVRHLAPEFIFYGLLISWIPIVCSISKIDPKRLFGFSRCSSDCWSWIGVVVPLVMLNYAVGWLEISGISLFSPSIANKILDMPSIKYSMGISNILLLAVKTTLVAITEEFWFRGWLLHRLAYKWDCRFAIIFSSLAFGILHINFVCGFIFSLVLSLVYLKTRTLFIPIAIHVLNNVIGCIWPDDIHDVVELRSLWMLHVFFLISSTMILFVVIRRCWPTNDQSLPYYDERHGNQR